MTKFRLKDQERQKALEKALHGFSKSFNRACETYFAQGYLNYVDVYNDDEEEWKISFLKEDIEVLKGYDANNWNWFPDVAPPANVPMQLEMRAVGHHSYHGAIFGVGAWKDINTDEVLWPRENFESVSIRFRRWDADHWP